MTDLEQYYEEIRTLQQNADIIENRLNAADKNYRNTEQYLLKQGFTYLAKGHVTTTKLLLEILKELRSQNKPRTE